MIVPNMGHNEKNPLTRAQKRLLKESLKRLFSPSLYEESIQDEIPEKRPEYLKEMVIKNALTAIILDN